MNLLFLCLLWQSLPVRGTGHPTPPSEPSILFGIVIGLGLVAPFWRVFLGIGKRLGDRIIEAHQS